jgi:putative cofactor-binding repeat protein
VIVTQSGYRIDGRPNYADPSAFDGWGRYVAADDMVLAVVVTEPFAVLEPDGSIGHGAPGDYLVRGIGGDMFPLPSAVFVRGYVRVGGPEMDPG